MNEDLENYDRRPALKLRRLKSEEATHCVNLIANLENYRDDELPTFVWNDQKSQVKYNNFILVRKFFFSNSTKTSLQSRKGKVATPK